MQAWLDKTIEIETILAERATDGTGDEARYITLRRELMDDPDIAKRLPDFMRPAFAAPNLIHSPLEF